MDFNVNFKNIGYLLFPHFLRKENLLKLWYSFVKPLQTLNNNGIQVTAFGQEDKSFYQWYLFIKNFLRFNGQVIYLEKYLNDVYSTGATYPYSLNGGIYITETTAGLFYVYNIAEGKEKYLYNVYQSGTTYANGEFIVFGNKIYQSIQNGNTGNQPDISPLWWTLYSSTQPFVYNTGELSSSADFIVNVPGSVSYTEAQMKSQINQ